MRLQDFIRSNKEDIDKHIIEICECSMSSIDYRERELWVLNDEMLYNWARSEGANI